MTSMNPYDSAARWAAHHNVPHREHHLAPEMDPVHPQPRPRPAAVTATMEPRPAAELGTPAVLDHRVVALDVGAGPSPLIVHAVDEDRAMMPLEAQVWARAGRMTVVADDGSELKLTVLGVDEAEGLRLGEHWPVGEPEGVVKRVASAAVHDVGDVLTFPAWLARTTRLSGRRNAALHGLVRRLREASPGTAVFYGQTIGFEHHRPEQARPYRHHGPVGREGYPPEL
jgi:hypothetical protein